MNSSLGYVVNSGRAEQIAVFGVKQKKVILAMIKEWFRLFKYQEPALF